MESSEREQRKRGRKMLSATAIGALLGLGTQMYSNALRKLPYMRRIHLSISLFAIANSIPFLTHEFLCV